MTPMFTRRRPGPSGSHGARCAGTANRPSGLAGVLLIVIALALPAGLPLLALGQGLPAAGAYSAPAGVPANAANPLMSLVLTGNYADYSSLQPFKVPGFALGPESGPGRPGFQLGESEVTLYGNIDPYLFGWAVLSFAPDAGVAVEEAFIQTTALPYGFIAKAGRFHSSIGYMNVLHRHADDFIDAPLVYSAFLDGQLADDGLQLRWVAPTDVYLQFGAEFFNGATYPAGGSANKGKGTNTQFINVADDVGEGGSYLLGLSHVDAQAAGQLGVTATGRQTSDEDPTRILTFTGSTSLNILSLVYKWSPLGNVRYTQLKLQAEVFSGDETGTYLLGDPAAPGSLLPIDATGANRLNRSGWYAQGVYKFLERWRVGARYSEVTAEKPKDPAGHWIGTDLDPRGRTPSIGSAIVEFWPSEFSQFRLQYSQDQSNPQRSVDRWYLQYIVTLGAHAAHAY